MKDDTILVLVAAGVATLVVYKLYKNTLGSPWNDRIGQQALENAGAIVRSKSDIPGDVKTYAQAGNTTYGFLPGDYDKLNLAQKTLITFDKIVPGTWLTRLALS